MTDINDILGIPKKPKELMTLEEIMPPSLDEMEEKQLRETEKQFDFDFITARNNLLFVLDSTKSALGEISLIAREKEDAKSYDSLNSLLKTLNETSRTLIEMHDRRKKFKEQTFKMATRNGGAAENISVNNAIFVGSSSELRKLISNMKAETNVK